MAPSSKKIKANNEEVVPVLPTDLLCLVFGELKMAERASLATSTKRFRQIDLNLTKKVFKWIRIHWRFNNLSILMKSDCVEYIFSNDAFNDPQKSELMQRLFKGSTKHLHVEIDDRDGPLRRTDPEMDSIMALTTGMRCRKLLLDVKTKRDLVAAEALFTALAVQKVPSIQQIAVRFGCRQTQQNVDIVRSMVQTLPTIAKFKLDWASDPIDEEVIDSNTLVYLASKVNHLDFGNAPAGQLATQSVWALFEEMTQARTHGRLISLKVAEDFSDALWNTVNPRYDEYELGPNHTSFCDEPSNSLIHSALKRSGRYNQALKIHKYIDGVDIMYPQYDMNVNWSK